MTDEPQNPIHDSIPPPEFQQDGPSPLRGETRRDQVKREWAEKLRLEQKQFNSMPFPVAPTGTESAFIKRWWRPAMAWQYLFVCLFDFIGGPIASMFFFSNNPESFVQWTTLTLQYGGVYHMSMGVIVGVTAYSRGQEKLKGIER